MDENDQIVTEPTSVTLYAGSNVAMTLSDTSDGTYRFENIPAGDFTLASRDEVYGRRAFGMGTISLVRRMRLVDLKFLGAGDIVGTVKITQAIVLVAHMLEPNPVVPIARACDPCRFGWRFVFTGIPWLKQHSMARDPNDGILSASLVEIKEPGAIVEKTLDPEPGFLVRVRSCWKTVLKPANATVRASMEGQPIVVNTDSVWGFSVFSRAFPPGELVISASLDQRRGEEPVFLDANGQTNGMYSSY